MKRREFTLRHTKNLEPRTVPMTPEVHAVFADLWRERRLDSQRVFIYKGRPLRSIKTSYKAACRRAGITNLRLHDFRHTSCTNMRRAGVDTMTAMKIAGHKSEKMHRRYNQIAPEDLHQAASKLSAYHANTLITLDLKQAVGQNATLRNGEVGA